MQTLLRLALPTLALFLSVHVSSADDAKPTITVSDDGKRAIARYGVANDVERQSKLAVKELSFLIKKYPDAKEWAVAYNTAPKLWRILQYDIERRQLMEVSMTKSVKSNQRGNDFYPVHIHRAAQQSLNIEGLWDIGRSK